MANWLKNLDIRRISFVRKDKSKPVHPRAKLLFVKSEEKQFEKEESKKMSLLDFLKGKRAEFDEVLKEEEVVDEVKKADEPADAPEEKEKEKEYVSKSEFTEQMEALEGKMNSLIEAVNKAVVDNTTVKEEVTKSLSDFTKDFLTAYEADQLKVQKAVVEKKREEVQKEVLPDQEDISNIVKKSSHLDGLFFLNNSQNMNSVVEKGLKDGTLKGVNIPEGDKSYDKAFSSLFGGE